MSTSFDLAALAKIIRTRRGTDAQTSWTARLFARGNGAICRKLGEEALETILAAMEKKNGDKVPLVKESADLIYHLLVLLAFHEVDLDDVLEELEKRSHRSGIAEKRARQVT